MSSLQALKDLNDIFIDELKENDNEIRLNHAARDENGNHRSREIYEEGRYGIRKVEGLIKRSIYLMSLMSLYSKVESNLGEMIGHKYIALEFKQSEITDEICAELRQERMGRETQAIKDQLAYKACEIDRTVVLLPESKILIEKLKDALK